jgi:tetrapyrrole methylase family protein / MazG family protein
MSVSKFQKLVDIVARLRAPGGCPWDREQTLDSIIHKLIEETEETAAAIHLQDYQNLKEELGDVLLNVLMQVRIAEEAKLFTLDQVLDQVTQKIIRRHPHVFGDKKFKTSAEVLKEWHRIKKEEKKA